MSIVIYEFVGLDESDNESSASVEHFSEPVQGRYERIDAPREYTPIQERKESKGEC